MEHLATGGKPKNPQKLEKVDRAEQMHLLREIQNKIDNYQIPDDGDYKEWECLWFEKRKIKARLNTLNA